MDLIIYECLYCHWGVFYYSKVQLELRLLKAAFPQLEAEVNLELSFKSVVLQQRRVPQLCCCVCGYGVRDCPPAPILSNNLYIWQEDGC